MAGSDPESDKGVVGVEEDDKDTYQGGVDAAGVKLFLQSCHSVSVALWFREVGGYPRMGWVIWGFLD